MKKWNRKNLSNGEPLWKRGKFEITVTNNGEFRLWDTSRADTVGIYSSLIQAQEGVVVTTQFGHELTGSEYRAFLTLSKIVEKGEGYSGNHGFADAFRSYFKIERL